VTSYRNQTVVIGHRYMFHHIQVGLFVIILHSAAGGHGISCTYFLPTSSVTERNKSKVVSPLLQKTNENHQKTTSTFTPPHHSTPRDLSSLPPPPLHLFCRHLYKIRNPSEPANTFLLQKQETLAMKPLAFSKPFQNPHIPLPPLAHQFKAFFVLVSIFYTTNKGGLLSDICAHTTITSYLFFFRSALGISLSVHVLT